MDREQLLDVKRAAQEEVQALSKTVLEMVSPPAGPYAFFAHSAHCLEGLADIERILARLFEGREALTKMAHEEDALKRREDEYTDPIPEEIQVIVRRQHELGGQRDETGGPLSALGDHSVTKPPNR